MSSPPKKVASLSPWWTTASPHKLRKVSIKRLIRWTQYTARPLSEATSRKGPKMTLFTWALTPRIAKCFKLVDFCPAVKMKREKRNKNKSKVQTRRLGSQRCSIRTPTGTSWSRALSKAHTSTRPLTTNTRATPLTRLCSTILLAKINQLNCQRSLKASQIVSIPSWGIQKMAFTKAIKVTRTSKTIKPM